MNITRNVLVASAGGVLAGMALIAFIVATGPQPVFTPQQEQEEPAIVAESQEQAEEREEQVEIEIHDWIAQPAPGELRGIYLTKWTAGSQKRMEEIKNLAKEGIINAVVIDIKDFSGYVAYDTNVSLADEIGAEEVAIKEITAYLASLKEAGLYTIARITVFQDPVLAEARPDLAVKSAAANDEELWLDNKGLAWLDPASQEVWKYHADLAKDAFNKGFDEVNFDYVRFPSDGDVFDASYPFWDETTPLEVIIASFFAYLHEELGTGVTSVDLFGLSAANTWDDMGIGQVLEDTFLYFDYISPMVYPSHFALSFLGFEYPDEHPYEIVEFSMRRAQERLDAFSIEHEEVGAKLRPWLQYFDLKDSRVKYTPEVIREQITATREALKEEYQGYLLWNSANIYPMEELKEIVFGPTLEDVVE